LAIKLPIIEEIFMAVTADLSTLELVRAHVGQEILLTDWLTIDQKRIDLFAQATEDFQWIHVDTERAKASSPFGGTIAHGFLTLSLLGGFYEQNMSMPFADVGVNYGLNKVRFTSPVLSGSRVRGRLTLLSLEDLPGAIQMTIQVVVEIEGQEKPACVAESVVRRYFTAKVSS
jgi:acyl dehydratase